MYFVSIIDVTDDGFIIFSLVEVSFACLVYVAFTGCSVTMPVTMSGVAIMSFGVIMPCMCIVIMSTMVMIMSRVVMPVVVLCQ